MSQSQKQSLAEIRDGLTLYRTRSPIWLRVQKMQRFYMGNLSVLKLFLIKVCLECQPSNHVTEIN